MRLLSCVPLLLFLASSAPAVVPIPAGPVIQPAHYFDLEGRTLRFQPSRRGYQVSSFRAGKPGPPGEPLGHADYQFIRSWGYRHKLPFPFAFGGKVWNEVFINGAGNLTFGRPEAELFPERDTWPHGTMQSVAGSLNNRAAAGQERMICALWGNYAPEDDKSKMYLRESARELVVTWHVQRYQWFGEGYVPLGPNEFELRLTPDGAIAFTYYKVSEKDGIVGVFPGGFYGKPLAALDDGSLEASLAGNTLRFSFPAVTLTPGDNRRYALGLQHGPSTCEIGIVSGNLVPYFGQECTGHPGYRMQDGRIELYATTFELQNALKSGAIWGANIDGKESKEQPFPFHGDAAAPPPRLSALHGYREGNIFEVFYYPHVSKQPFPLIRYIYSRVPPEDDFVAILTDFRIDDLHNHQGTHSAFAPPIQGVGEELKTAEDGKPLTGSPKLQVITGPIYLGPRFAESLEDDALLNLRGSAGRRYHNYANAVGWMSHEFGHRWGVGLRFRNPVTGKVENLANDSGHWLDLLNTPSMISVWKMFCDQAYVEKSQMEGFVYVDQGSGNFHREVPAWNIASGFSALDLYVMGLIAPEEVTDTFLIAHAEGEHTLDVRGQKVPVRIQDVIAAEGPRVPGVRDSQKRFRVALYLLHESGRQPYPDKLKQAEGVERSLVDYYRAATGGRMELVAAQPR
jgi:hypothetical protein